MDPKKTTIIKSNKGVNDKIYHLGFEYQQDGHNKDKTALYYACANYKSMACPGRLIRYLNKSLDEQLKTTQEHTHFGDGTLVGKAVSMQSLKRKARDNLDSGRTILAKISENMDVSTAAAMPAVKSMLQAVRRERQNNDLPRNPTSLIDLDIPDEYKNIDGELFLLYDSGPGPNRILIFTTKRNLELLKRADVMSMDGTFDIVPPLFEQLYTLQGRVNGWYLPLVYVLAPNKTKKMYEEVFSVISTTVPEFQPKYIISDFEIGAILAAKKFFPNAKMHGCFFHLCKSVYRHVQQVGLQQRYIEEPDFAVQIRKLLALAFVPVGEVVNRFEEMCKTDFWVEKEGDEDSQKLQQLLNYFEATYIGVKNRSKTGRKTVQFPPSMWSVYEITILGIPRTNNSLEAWHGVLKKTIGACHPVIFKFLGSLHDEQKFQELRMAKVISGHPPEITPRKYRELDKRILSVVKKYKEYAGMDYLETLAHNIYF